MYKFFAWQERGFWRGQKLVKVSSIPSMKKAVGGLQSFASLQTYSADGEVMFCPVYADLDGKDPKQAQHDAQYIVYLLGEMTNLIPDIYYSGNKGYHIIIPHKIEHPQCHLVAKHFYDYLAKDLRTLDKSVYRSQALLRLPGSPASRPGYFKTQITKDELMGLSHDAIADLAKVERIGQINECDTSKINDEFLAVIEEGKHRVPTWHGQPLQSYLGELGNEMTPCLVRMLEEPTDQGARNKTVYLLGRVFKKCGITEAQAIEMITSKPHWQSFEDSDRGVTSAIKSLYKSSKPPVIGCRTGADAELMQALCDPFCHFNKTHFSLINEKKVVA